MRNYTTLMERVKKGLLEMPNEAVTDARQRMLEREQEEIDRLNRVRGVLDVNHVDADGRLVPGDKVECEKCMNRGYSFLLLVSADGRSVTRYMKPCECLGRRAAVRRLRESGLERAVARYTFEAFRVDSTWQKLMYNAARKYAEKGVKEGAWMYIGGQSGAGKSHICTAAAGEIMKERELRYMLWPHEAQKIKAVVNDAEAYRAAVNPLQTAKVLYIDDFLKPVRDRNGEEAVASAADVRLAFDILDLRYVLNLPTIISGEWFSSEIGRIDEALAGRIVESAGEYLVDVGRDAERNYRLRDRTV